MVVMRVLWCSVLLVVGFVLISGNAWALSPYPAMSTGTDVSWPNCREQPEASHTAFGIVGVNDGLDFAGNPCLSQETSWFSDYSLYLSTGYPGLSYGRKYQTFPNLCSKNNNQCLAYNYGFNAARYAINFASLHDVHTTQWWLDVETVNSWTSNTQTNVTVLQGMITALKRYTFLPTIGFYAYPGQWDTLTGSWRNNYAAWVATGTTSRSSGIAACKDVSFDGSSTVLTQYTKALDKDYVCP
jgi:hypothetical protein